MLMLQELQYTQPLKCMHVKFLASYRLTDTQTASRFTLLAARLSAGARFSWDRVRTTNGVLNTELSRCSSRERASVNLTQTLALQYHRRARATGLVHHNKAEFSRYV